jgi:hypothetical protein
MAQYPWQAIVSARIDATHATLCGGAILSPTRIATAAHCVQGFAASQFTVTVGRADRSTSAGQVRLVAAADVMPSYGTPDGANDAAVLTLSAPLAFSDLDPTVKPIALVDPGTAIADGTALEVSGYGATAEGGSASQTLRAVTVNAVGDTACAADYALIDPPLDRDSELCAGAAGKDSCQGDSGGPLILRSSPPVLVGLVSTGYGCARAGYPGVYAEVAKPAINAFLAARSAPASTSPPALGGTAQVGQTLTCDPGGWTGSPAFAYSFLAGSSVLQGPGAGAAFTVPAGLEGASITCEVTATNPDGTTGAAQSAAVGPIAAAPAPAPVLPAPPVVVPKPVDRTAPKAKVVSRRCRGRRCSVTIRVSDAGYSAGVRSVTARLTTTYRTTCRRKGRRRPCTRSVRKTLRARAGKSGTWSVVASGVRYGRQRFTFTAVDRAGNRQAHATTATLTVKRPAKHRR